MTAMTSYERPQVATLVKRLEEDPRRIQAVFGPRQTGKTTLIRQALRRTRLPSRYIAVDEPEPLSPESPEIPRATDRTPASHRDGEWITEHWRRAREKAWAEGAMDPDRGFVLVFDEIQKVPGWSEVMKGLWDEDRFSECPLRVVISGSSPLTLQHDLRESLAGRFEPIRSRQWSFVEMKAAFGIDLDRYVFFGGYPGAAPDIGHPGRWRNFLRGSIVNPSVERDLLGMARVDQPALLTRLFGSCVRNSGRIVPYRQMLAELGGPGHTATLSRYLGLLGRIGLVTGLERYDGEFSLKPTSPKLNVLDVSLMTVESGYEFEQARADRSFWTRLTKTVVGAHLANTADAGVRLHYWKDGVDEVDFVLAGEPNLAAVQVDAGNSVRYRRGLDAFGVRFPVTREVVVGAGGVPLEEFLSRPAKHWLESDR